MISEGIKIRTPTPVVYATPSMSRNTSVTDLVGGTLVSRSDGDRYSSRSTLFTAVERTVLGLTALRNLCTPGWSRSWILRRSLGFEKLSSFVVDSEAEAEPGSRVPLGRFGSEAGVGAGAAGGSSALLGTTASSVFSRTMAMA